MKFEFIEKVGQLVIPRASLIRELEILEDQIRLQHLSDGSVDSTKYLRGSLLTGLYEQNNLASSPFSQDRNKKMSKLVSQTKAKILLVRVSRFRRMLKRTVSTF